MSNIYVASGILMSAFIIILTATNKLITTELFYIMGALLLLGGIFYVLG